MSATREPRPFTELDKPTLPLWTVRLHATVLADLELETSTWPAIWMLTFQCLHPSHCMCEVHAVAALILPTKHACRIRWKSGSCARFLVVIEKLPFSFV